MAGAFRVVPASLDAAAAQLAAAAEAVQAALGSLSGALGGTGGMAGDDRVGQQFAAQYDPAAAGVVEGLGRFADGLDSVADALRATAANYRGSDAQSVLKQGG